MGDMSEYERLMQEQRRPTSARFPMLPPELQPSDDDSLAPLGFGELTDAQKQRLSEEAALSENMQDRGTLERLQAQGEMMGYSPELITQTLGDIMYTGAAGGRYMMGEEGAGTDLAIGGTMMAAPFVLTPLMLRSIGGIAKKAVTKISPDKPARHLQGNLHNIDAEMTSRLKMIDDDLAAGKLKRVQADIYRARVEKAGEKAFRKAEDRYQGSLKTASDKSDKFQGLDAPGAVKPRQQSLLESLIPPEALATLRAYPDTKAARQARSVVNKVNNGLKAPTWRKDYLTPAQAKEALKDLGSYAEHAKTQAGDVMGQARSEAAYATRTRKRGKVPDDRRSQFESEDRALKMVQKEADEATSVRQPLEREKTYYTRDATGKIINTRKRAGNARLDLEKRREAWRIGGRKGPEPKLTDADYVDARSAPEYAHERKVREYDDLEEVKTKLKKDAAGSKDPSLDHMLSKEGQKVADKATAAAQEKAAREAFKRKPNFNDAEFSFVSETGRVDASKIEDAKEFIYRLRKDNKKVVKTDDGGFDVMDESGLLGGADMPEVDQKFLKSLKEFRGGPRGPVRRAPPVRPKNVKLDRDALRARRRTQIAESKPKSSEPSGPGLSKAEEDALNDAVEERMFSMEPGHIDYDAYKSPELRAKERAEALAQAERDAIAKSESDYAAWERGVREEQAAARGGFVGDRADYLDQVEAAKDQASRDRQLLDDEMFDQAKRDSFPTMSEREVLENLDELKSTFKDDPEAVKEIAEAVKSRLSVIDEKRDAMMKTSRETISEVERKKLSDAGFFDELRALDIEKSKLRNDLKDMGVETTLRYSPKVRMSRQMIAEGLDPKTGQPLSDEKRLALDYFREGHYKNPPKK